jgi:MFS family permease
VAPVASVRRSARAESPENSPTARTGVVIGVLATSGMLAALQQTLVVSLIPDLPDILGVTPTTASWAVTITILSGAVATPIVSRLADMVGKRRMVVIALATSTLGSALVAVGGSFVTVLAGRGLQGLAASLIPVGISIMRDALPKERVGFAVALMSATLGIGNALGLPLSGVLYGHFGFASIFWVAAGAGLVLTIAVLVFVKESTIRTPGRFDYLGAVLISSALAGALLGISKATDWGWRSGEVMGFFALSLVALAIWIPYQLRVNDPMVDLRTAVRRPVLLTNVASVLVAFAAYTNFLASGHQLQTPTASGYGFGLSVTEAGLDMMPIGLAMVALAPVSGRMLTRLGGRLTLLAGAGLMCLAYVYRVFATESVSEVVAGATLVGIGAALSFAAMPTLIMANVPITESASANGLNSLMRAIGGSTSSAVLAAVLASVSVLAAGRSFPSLEAFEDIYWISAAVALAAFVLTCFIPTDRARALASSVTGAGLETVVRGRLLPGGSHADRQAGIVSVMTLLGDPVDWARTDNDGHYSVALPGSGRYLLIANARGWAPCAQVLEFHQGTTELQVGLTQPLALSGTVLCAGVPLGGSRLILNAAAGEFVETTTSDIDGHFTMALPTAGAYIITAVDPTGERAKAQKLVVDALGRHVDIEVPQ